MVGLSAERSSCFTMTDCSSPTRDSGGDSSGEPGSVRLATVPIKGEERKHLQFNSVYPCSQRRNTFFLIQNASRYGTPFRRAHSQRQKYKRNKKKKKTPSAVNCGVVDRRGGSRCVGGRSLRAPGSRDLYLERLPPSSGPNLTLHNLHRYVTSPPSRSRSGAAGIFRCLIEQIT